jgi:hypothetical protein
MGYTRKAGPCLGCGEVGPLHAVGRCRRCYQHTDVVVTCHRCGRIRPTLPGRLRLCLDCYRGEPDRVRTWLNRRLPALGSDAPSWWLALADELANLCDWKTATGHLSHIEPLLRSGTDEPADVLKALNAVPAHRATAILTAEFFSRHTLVVLDGYGAQVDVRRQQYLGKMPERFRPGVERFIEYLEGGQRRAVLHGSRGLSDRTINYRLAALVHLAGHLTRNGIRDWSGVTTADLESFLTIDVSSRLAVIRAFFAFARRHKIVLVNPATGIERSQVKGYRGRLLTPPEQRQLVRRWAGTDIDSRERVVGLLCLLHAASNIELRHLTVDDVNPDIGTVRFRHRPRPIPLDPLTVDALRSCLEQRALVPTTNSHVLVTHHTRLHHGPCSNAFPIFLLAKTGVTTQVLRQTRLADLAHRTDPRVVASAIGITREAALHYLIGVVDHEEAAFEHLHAPASKR